MGFGDFLKDKLKSLAESSKGFGVSANTPPPEYQYGDRLTQDKRVIALRRQRNRQMDMVEKRRLEAQINNFEFREASEGFVGKSALFKAKKREPSVKSKSCGFLGKGSL